MLKIMLAVMLLLATPLALAAETAADTGFLVTVLGFFESFPAWLTALTTLLVALQGVAALTATKKDDEIIAKILTVFKTLVGLNVNKTK